MGNAKKKKGPKASQKKPQQRASRGPVRLAEQRQADVRTAPSRTAPRSVLGRGLSALMSSTTVPVRPEQDEQVQPEFQIQREQIQQESLSERKPSQQPVTKRPEEVRAFQVLAGSALASKPAEPQLAQKADATTELTEGALHYLPLEAITACESQPRRNFSEAELEALAQSIRESGMLQPILVRRSKLTPGCFEIVAGERRYRAASRAGLNKVPVIVRSLADKEAFQLGIIENVQREDLNPVEEALAYQRLISEFGETQASIAAAIGRDRVTIANALRLLNLPESVQALLIAGKISSGHGRALLMVTNLKTQHRLAIRALKKGLSVRALERLAGALESKAKQGRGETPAKSKRSLAAIELEDRLRRALGTKVQVALNESGSGELRISFFSKDELANLMERFNA